MQIDVRSGLVASAALSLVGALAVTPVLAPNLAPMGAQVALTALDNPITALLDTAQMGQNYLLAGYYNGSSAPTPGAGEANWWYAGMDQTGGDVLNFLLARQIPLGYYKAVGLLPQLSTQGLPVLRQLSLNIYDYFNVTLTGLNDAVRAVSTGLWELPAAVVNAVRLATEGQFADAVTVLNDAITVPVSNAIGSVLDAGSYVLASATARLSAVVKAIPQIAATFVSAAAGGVTVLVGKTAAIAQQLFGDLAALDFQGAWNTAAQGLLSPSGLPGTLWNLTIGAGVQTGPITDPETDIKTNFVPSIRTAVQAGIWTVQDALATPAPSAAAVASASLRAAAVKSRRGSQNRTATAASAARSTSELEHTPRAARSAERVASPR